MSEGVGQSGNPVSRMRARAQFLQDSGDVFEEAREMLLKCMRGQVDPRTGEIQRKAALDVLGATLDGWPTEALLAEVDRRVAEGGK